jgi:predicted porin
MEIYRMKKSLLAIAALTAFAGAAQAQSSVTVYGIIDVGVMASTNSGNLNSSPLVVSNGVAGANQTTGTGGSYGKSSTAFGGMGGGESQSRLGFKGQEDLGGGTKAIFTLETGFNPMTGSVANTGIPGNNRTGTTVSGDTALQGQLFGRAAYAGLSNDTYGTLTVGRQQNLMLDNIPSYDPVNAQMFSPIAFAGSFGGGGATDNSRVDQAIKYVYKNGNWNANLLYAPGGIAGTSSVGTTTGAQIGWENEKFGVQAIASHSDDATSLNACSDAANCGAAVGVNTSNMVAAVLENTTAYQLTAKYNPVGSLWIKAGYEREIIGSPTNGTMYTTANMPQLASGYVVGSYTQQAAQKNVNVFWLGANYNFTPTIKGSIGYYYVGVPAYGNTASSFGASFNGATGGTQQFTSAMVEYYLSKRTNLYAAFMNANATGGQNGTATFTGSNGSSASQTYGLGMRHTF